jgi:hypothetical protein
VIIFQTNGQRYRHREKECSGNGGTERGAETKEKQHKKHRTLQQTHGKQKRKLKILRQQ